MLQRETPLGRRDFLACAAAFILPPQEAFEEDPEYCHWTVRSTEIGKHGDTARIELKHPSAPVVAVLLYRLVSSVVKEEVRR